jgi:single-strand DNA-binding protein
MANYNRIILVGNLTRDPQLKYLPSQTQVVEFGLAVNHKFKSQGQDREEVLFIDCACFGKGAEIINTYCHKGKPLLVEGRLKLDTWEDKQGGGKRSKHTVVVDNFQLMGGRSDAGGAAASNQSYDEGGAPPPPARPVARPPQQAQRPPVRPPQQAQPPAEPPFGEEQTFSEDDIPF